MTAGTPAGLAEDRDAAAAAIERACRRPAGRPDPRSVLAFLLATSILALGARSVAVPALAALFAAALLAAGGRGRAGARFLLAVAFFIGLFEASRHIANPALATLLGVAGFWLGRFATAAAAGWWAVTALRPTELIEALRRLRLPNTVVVPLAVVLRILPVIAVEARAVVDAMTLRGLRPDARGLAAHPLRTGELVLIPLLTTVVRSGDELAAAALVRGLGGPTRPTGVTRLGFRAVDAAVLAMIAALIALTLSGWGTP